jgi:nucleotide-binding universal stress UspA family protein
MDERILVDGSAADPIAVGTHGRRGPSRLFLGSDAEQIVRLAPVPVLLVRAAGSVKDRGSRFDGALANMA